MAIVKNFSLDPNDKDILRWLDEQPNQSAAIREAIRYYLAKEEGVTLADVLAEIRSLPSRLHVVAVQGEMIESGEEPEEAAVNLDSLLDRLGNGAID
jgi:Arc/MetJ-type ribon-helix-helix transcriptional regulator